MLGWLNYIQKALNVKKFGSEVVGVDWLTCCKIIIYNNAKEIINLYQCKLYKI